MMRPRWWAGWRENAIQQSEEMPRVRACDEEERADRQGRPAVEMPGLPVELDDAAAAAQAGADAGGVPFLAAGAVIPKGGGLRGRRPRLRKRIAWCWRIRPRIAPPDARRHTVMADGTYMGHGWCLIIAIDGQTGEVLDWQWCAHESEAAYLALFSGFPRRTCSSVFSQVGVRVSSLIFFGFRHEACRPVVCFTGCPSCRT